jgi:PAS domain S-box-containing protein
VTCRFLVCAYSLRNSDLSLAFLTLRLRSTDIHDEQVAKELSTRQLEIEHNERKYRLLAETIPQLVFTFSPEFGVTYANQKWEDYSGKPLNGAQGLAFMAQVHSEDRHKLRLPDLPENDSSGVCWQEEVRLQSKEGNYRWFLIKCISVQQNEIADARWFGTW